MESAALKSYQSIAVKPLPKSQVEINGTIAAETWAAFRKQALKNINETVTIDGFSKGMVPENVLISKVGNATILEEMAEMALSAAYGAILADNKIDAIGRPQVRLTKLADNNPLEFTITTAVVPKVTLPEYKKLAAEVVKTNPDDEPSVTDKDIDDAILKIRKARASHEGHDHTNMTPEDHEKAVMDSLPEFNDDFVRGLGGDFKDIEDFKAKVRIMIGENKKSEAKEKTRIRIADVIASASTIDLPDIMIEIELDRSEAQFKQDIERMNVKLEDYLSHSKKTIEDLRSEWRPHAEKKAKLQLILNAIAEQEKLKPTKKEVETEVDHIVEHYKEADRERAAVYAETVLSNEKVFQFLEDIK